MNESKSKFRWIDESIDISSFYDKLPRHHREFIAEIEQADLDDDWYNYATLCDDFESHTKLLLLDDVITDKEWDMLCSKYAIRY